MFTKNTLKIIKLKSLASDFLLKDRFIGLFVSISCVAPLSTIGLTCLLDSESVVNRNMSTGGINCKVSNINTQF